MKHGIDVSEYQGNIVDWKEIRNSGYDIVIIRAGYRGWRTGELVNDKKFETYMEGAQEAGFQAGAYWVTQAINEKEAREEAHHLAEMCKKYKIEAQLAIDVEWAGDRNSGQEGRANELSPEERTAVINAFADEIRLLGYEPMCYANQNWLLNFIEPKLNCPVWVAHYWENPDVSIRYKIEGYNVCGWQYTSSARFTEIPDNSVDLNVFYSSEEQMEKAEETEISPDFAYKVKTGDSWWGIAQKIFGDGRRYPELQKLNPDVLNLYAGMILVVPINSESNFEKNEESENAKESVNQEINLSVGDIVKVMEPIDYDSGKILKLWHDEYEVLEVSGDRVVIGVGGAVTSAVAAGNLELVRYA